MCKWIYVIFAYRCSLVPGKCSSRGLPSRRPPGEGILSSDPWINPHFHSWRKVELHYCTNDVYSGNTTQQSATGKLILHGHHVVPALLNHLVQYHQLSKAKTVILAGTSAGAYGVIRVKNYMRKLLTNPKLYCIIDSGYQQFTEHIDIKGCNDIIDKSLQVKFKFWGDRQLLNYIHDKWWRDLTVPMFLVLNRWDFIATAFHCIQIKDQNQLELDTWSNAVSKRIIQIQEDNVKVGLFVPGCIGHGLLNADNDFSQVRSGILHTTLSDNLWKWLSSQDSDVGYNYAAAIDDCEVNKNILVCNLSCTPRNITETVQFMHDDHSLHYERRL